MKELAKKASPRFLEPVIITEVPSYTEYVEDPDELLTKFYWGAKFCLFRQGIVAEPEKKDHERFLKMRLARESK